MAKKGNTSPQQPPTIPDKPPESKGNERRHRIIAWRSLPASGNPRRHTSRAAAVERAGKGGQIAAIRQTHTGRVVQDRPRAASSSSEKVNPEPDEGR